MVLKTVPMVGALPKLELGDPTSRATRLKQWLSQVTQSLEPTGPHVTSWWQWAHNSAAAAHRFFLFADLAQRETGLPLGGVPPPQYTGVEP